MPAHISDSTWITKCTDSSYPITEMFPKSSAKELRRPLTELLIQARTDASQQRQGDQITEAGSNGGGHIVWVDANLPGCNDNPDHDKTWAEEERKNLSS